MKKIRFIMMFITAISLLSTTEVLPSRPVSTYIGFGETNLLDNNLNQALSSNGYSTVSDKSGFWGMGVNGRLRNNIYWDFHFDFFYTYTENSEASLSITHSLITAGICYKLFEKESFRIIPGIGFGSGQSRVEVTPAFRRINPSREEIEYSLEFPYHSTIFDKYYSLFNVQCTVDKSLHLGTSKDGTRTMFLIGMRTGLYLTLGDSEPDLGGVNILDFPENNLDNYYLNFVIGLQFRKGEK